MEVTLNWLTIFITRCHAQKCVLEKVGGGPFPTRKLALELFVECSSYSLRVSRALAFFQRWRVAGKAAGVALQHQPPFTNSIRRFWSSRLCWPRETRRWPAWRRSSPSSYRLQRSCCGSVRNCETRMPPSHTSWPKSAESTVWVLALRRHSIQGRYKEIAPAARLASFKNVFRR